MTLNVENLSRLIAHLETVPEELFDMSMWPDADEVLECGTPACIAGWCEVLATQEGCKTPAEAGVWLGLSEHIESLFTPRDYEKGSDLYPLSRALRTLRHLRSEYLRTGQVVIDWDAPDERTPWSPPVAIEQRLPSELTDLLRATAREATR